MAEETKKDDAKEDGEKEEATPKDEATPTTEPTAEGPLTVEATVESPQGNRVLTCAYMYMFIFTLS